MEVLFWTLIAITGYVYVGYPLFLLLIRCILGERTIAAAFHEPAVSLIISAYNEEHVIADKLHNSLQLDYPRSALEIIVVSDASTDRTDEIVTSLATENIRLLRIPTRGGKTLGLNEAVKQAKGDILIFSDANAMYDKQAIRMLIRNFADVEIGAVVGESRYSKTSYHSDRNESLYWKYELTLKQLETSLGSVVGGDGAIYAIRRQHYKPMAADALSDFVNPLQIVQQRHRCVYEPSAFSIEQAAGSFNKEFIRKVRIANRAWRATMRQKALLNPFKFGLYSIQLISHKLLRWLVPFFLIGLFSVSIAIMDHGPIYTISFLLQLVFYASALAGWILANHYELPFLLSVPFYFCLMNLACLKGISEAYLGKTYTTWTTVRSDST